MQGISADISWMFGCVSGGACWSVLSTITVPMTTKARKLSLIMAAKNFIFVGDVGNCNLVLGSSCVFS